MIGNLAFLNPWILAGLVLLPALWFLLRVTPPAPKLIRFPPARFLAGLHPDEQTASHTPWWILLLRVLCAALIIVALARPVLNPAADLSGHGPVRIVMDNGWAAAQNWDEEKEQAAVIIDHAGRENRNIYILTTAPEDDGTPPRQYGPLGAGAAQSILNGLKPYPWPADYAAAAKTAQAAASHDSLASTWLSTGLQDNDTDAFAQLLQNQGELHVYTPAASRLPLLLRSVSDSGAKLGALVDTSAQAPANLSFAVQALGTDGRILDSQRLTIAKAGGTATAAFDLPETLRGQASQIRIAGRRGAGTVLLLDERYRRRTVGLAIPAGQENNAPLVEAGFYLRQALDPYADIVAGPVRDLLAKKPPVIVMPDTAALPPDELDALEKWVRAGGLLLRFAGPNMTEGENFLTPVPLRRGGRALSGAMTWDKPEHIAPFPPASPYFGLTAPKDVTVNRQLLAEPVDGIEKMTWAALDDGTPLITAKALDRGLLVLIHTTATPQWSDLALSGLYVQILQRTIALAGQPASALNGASGTLQPLLILDGFGNVGAPGGFVQPIPATALEKTMPAPQHPPGLYGRPGFRAALNLGNRLPPLRVLTALPDGAEQLTYGAQAREKELMPQFLTAAFALFLADWLIMILLQTGLSVRRPAASAALALFLLFPAPARAATSADMAKYAGDVYLAYIRTGVPAIDSQSEQGLGALNTLLTQRTSVEPGGVVAVDPEHDELAFFPLIYWPVIPNQPALSPLALHNIQIYLDHGGTIMFDTRDQSNPGNNAALRTLTAGLNIPPLIPLPKDHVMTRAFYLLRDFPERYDEGALWVEENSVSGHDGVSSVIVASHDWAANWANAGNSTSQNGEMDLRFGVNLVMYALTGNYKNDQVHMKEIMERLGE